MVERRIVRQTFMGGHRSGLQIVFRWQESYPNTVQTRAALGGRGITIDDITADFDRQPRYCCTAYAFPPGESADREKLRALIRASGFRKDTIMLDWVAEQEGEASVTTLMAALKHAGISATHYGDVPPPFVVRVETDGLL